ncbi:terpene synthase family protein [Methylocaldum sp. MU1018]
MITPPEFYCPFPSRLNPHADAANRHTLAWVRQFNLVSGDREWRRLEASRFSWLAARAYPDAPLDGLDIVSDWNTWLFIRDDQCDESGFGRNPDDLARFHERLTEILTGREPGEADLPLAHALHELCSRLRQTASNAWMCRFILSVIEYFESSEWEARNRAAAVTPDPETYIAMRPFTGGLYTDIELIDVVENIDLPLHVRKHETLQSLIRMANNVVCWSNDIISFAKEVQHNDVHNLVVTFQHHHRLSLQEAVRQTAELTNQEVRNFVALQERLPAFGSGIDADVQRFVSVLCSWMRGNLDWSYTSGRYAVPAAADFSEC